MGKISLEEYLRYSSNNMETTILNRNRKNGTQKLKK